MAFNMAEAVRREPSREILKVYFIALHYIHKNAFLLFLPLPLPLSFFFAGRLTGWSCLRGFRRFSPTFVISMAGSTKIQMVGWRLTIMLLTSKNNSKKALHPLTLISSTQCEVSDENGAFFWRILHCPSCRCLFAIGHICFTFYESFWAILSCCTCSPKFIADYWDFWSQRPQG